MLWASIIVLIGFLWLIGKISMIVFSGLNITLLILASMIVLAETITGRNVLKKVDVRFSHSTGERVIQNEDNVLIQQTYQEAL